MSMTLPTDPALPLAGCVRDVVGALLAPPAGPERPQPCGVFDGAVPVPESLCFGGIAAQAINAFPAPRAATTPTSILPPQQHHHPPPTTSY